MFVVALLSPPKYQDESKALVTTQTQETEENQIHLEKEPFLFGSFSLASFE